MIWKLSKQKDWEALESQFSWVADMKYVEQHKKHHAEGNVAIHTRMVIDELQNLPEYQILSEQNKEILWAAALLHDVEKRSTSVNEGNGNISASGHARKGEYTARTVLFKDIPAPFHIREQIASLVRFHGMPLWFMEKADPAKKLNEISLRLNTLHLKILSKADVKGRICEDAEFLSDSLELFEMFCKEQGCWEQAKFFATSNAKFKYFNTSDAYADYIPFDKFKCTAIIMSGLPGMGKDHYIQSLSRDIPVISIDAIRRKYRISPTDKTGNGQAVQIAKEEARSYLRKGQDFLWNATNITRQMRVQLVDLFASYGAKVKIIYIEKPYKIWRNQNRNREYPLPETVLDRLLSKLEIPQLQEAHELDYIVES